MKEKILILAIATLLSACDSEHLHIDEEYHHVRVYKDDLASACDNSASSMAIKVKEHGAELLNEAIEVHCAQKGHDGLSYTESCASETGSINIFTIHNGDLATAESLGFSRLAELPDAQFDESCEYKVISDHRKYSLLNQLDYNLQKWDAINASEYKFNYHVSYADCPTFDVLPTIEITVNDNIITSAYILDLDTFLTETDNLYTVNALYDEIQLQLGLTPIEAGLDAYENYKAPKFNDLGVPTSYFINAGGEECDAVNYSISELEIISTN